MRIALIVNLLLAAVSCGEAHRSRIRGNDQFGNKTPLQPDLGWNTRNDHLRQFPERKLQSRMKKSMGRPSYVCIDGRCRFQPTAPRTPSERPSNTAVRPSISGMRPSPTGQQPAAGTSQTAAWRPILDNSRGTTPHSNGSTSSVSNGWSGWTPVNYGQSSTNGNHSRPTNNGSRPTGNGSSSVSSATKGSGWLPILPAVEYVPSPGSSSKSDITNEDPPRPTPPITTSSPATQNPPPPSGPLDIPPPPLINSTLSPTTAPTIAPTNAPSFFPTQDATAEDTGDQTIFDSMNDQVGTGSGNLVVDQRIYKNSVTTDPFIIQASGVFDAERSESIIVGVIENLMKPYIRAYGKSLIESYEISIKFFPEYGTITTSSTGSVSMTAYFDISMTLELSSTDSNELSSFNKDSATALVGDFFKGNHLIRLKRTLVQEGVNVRDIEIVESLPAKPSSGTPETPVPHNFEPDDRSVALIAAVASGSILLFAVASVLIVTRNRSGASGKFSGTGALSETSSVPSYTDTTDSGNRRIRPSALQVRRKREAASVGSFSSAYEDRSLSDDHDIVHNASVGLERPRTNIIQHFLPVKEELDRLENGLVSSAALTCLDEQVEPAMPDRYPEFHVYAHLPKPEPRMARMPYQDLCPASPAWSLGSGSFHSHVDEEYAEQRRRWHDEANDLALLALPDHTSDGYTSESTSGREGSSHTTPVNHKQNYDHYYDEHYGEQDEEEAMEEDETYDSAGSLDAPPDEEEDDDLDERSAHSMSLILD